MDFSKGVLFDPGYSKYILAFAPNIDAAYNVLFATQSQHQRKFKFQMIYPQLLKLLENTVAFYLGCLLWATFISKNFAESPKDILDNDYLGREVNEESMLYEVNYAISYIEKIQKDCKYYLGKTCVISPTWSQILNTYKEFLTINNFLVDAKSTSDIKLPSDISQNIDKESLDTILDKIEQVVHNGELKELFKIQDLILSS